MVIQEETQMIVVDAEIIALYFNEYWINILVQFY